MGTPRKNTEKYDLIIVESPGKVKSIQSFVGKKYKVMASVGHITKLATTELPSVKNNKGAGRGYGFDTETFTPKYSKDLKNKRDVIKRLKSAIDDANHIYLATDNDREGEMIAYQIKNTFKIPESKYSRIRFNEITKDAVLNALENPGKINMNLVDAAEARRLTDRFIGFDLSRLVRKVSNAIAESAGRVQSALLKIIKDHDEVIENFVPEKYWEIELDTEYNNHPLLFKCTKRINSKEELNKLKEKIKDKTIELKEIKYTEKTKEPKPPFRTSTLQQEAASKLGFSTAKTMQVAQELYEGVKIDGKHVGLITYMRTDSIRLNEDFLKTVDKWLKDHNYKVGKLQQSDKKPKGQQDAHEGIRPTNIQIHPDQIKHVLTKDQYDLYNLIWRRTVASKMQPMKYKNQSFVIEIGKYKFTANINMIIESNYFDIYGIYEQSEFGKHIPEKGKTVKLKKIIDHEKETKPPARYSEAKLVSIMEEYGIGRPSTYSATIKKLKDRKYIEKDGSGWKTTDLGRETVELLEKTFPDIINHNYTSILEERFDKIENGEEEKLNFLRETYDDFFTKYQAIYNELIKNIKGPVVVKDCPNCDGKLVIRTNKKTKEQFLGCTNYPKCKTAEPLLENEKEKPKETGKLCPICSKPIVERKNRKTGDIFYACSGYPECKTIITNLETMEYRTPEENKNKKKKTSKKETKKK